MTDINELRRLAQAALVAPDGLSAEWMDRLGQFQEFVSPAAISELLDRLDAADRAWKESDKACRDLTEKVIPNIREQLESAEKERDDVAQQLVQAELGKQKLNAECDALRAKIEAMEKQEPAPSVPGTVRKITQGFRWDGEKQHHVPTLELEFEPVPANSPNDAKGWQDRDQLAKILAAAPEAKPCP